MERQEAEENCLYDFILMPSELQTAFLFTLP
nr:MAG TPA: hypothetical protein [Caudoviricetes sp.]